MWKERAPEFKRGKQAKKLTCEIRTAAEKIVLAWYISIQHCKGSEPGLEQPSTVPWKLVWLASEHCTDLHHPPSPAASELMDCDLLLYYLRNLLLLAHFLVQEWHKWDFSVFSYLCFKNILRLLHRSWKLGGLRVQNKADTSLNSWVSVLLLKNTP